MKPRALEIAAAALAVLQAAHPVFGSDPPGRGAGEIPDVITTEVARFIELLGSRLPDRRVEGVQGLAHLKHWPGEDALLDLLEDDSYAVRREAVLARGRCGTVKTIRRFIDLLDDPSWEIRRNAALSLRLMTAQNFADMEKMAWARWWAESTLAQKEEALLNISAGPPGTSERGETTRQAFPGFIPTAPGRRSRSRPPIEPPAHWERHAALRALVHLATSPSESALVGLLRESQSPPLDSDEKNFICATLERIGSTRAIPVLAAQRSEAAAWAIGRLGGPEAEQALLQFPKTLATLLALDRLRSTQAGPFLPHLVAQMGLVTFRGQPDDVMNRDWQPVQRAGANLIRRSGLALLLIECVLQELEDTMQPPLSHGPCPARPPGWEKMLEQMRSELKPGFVREDGVTTSQPVAALCYTIDDPALAGRLIPLLRHPAFVVRVYIALALGRLHAREAIPVVVDIIREGYAFSDSVALASGKHFDQSQTVRWRGFLCMALGRLGGEPARLALEAFAADPGQPRDIRYGAVVGLGFISSPRSLPVLDRVAKDDIIWLVRDEARQVAREIQLTDLEARR